MMAIPHTGDALTHPHATSHVANYRVILRVRQGAQRLVTEVGLFPATHPAAQASAGDSSCSQASGWLTGTCRRPRRVRRARGVSGEGTGPAPASD